MGVIVPDTTVNTKKCICPGCPTFAESRLSGIAFCAKGKAKETVKKKACLCPKCSVWKNYKLQYQFYCEIEKAADL